MFNANPLFDNGHFQSIRVVSGHPCKALYLEAPHVTMLLKGPVPLGDSAWGSPRLVTPIPRFYILLFFIPLRLPFLCPPGY